MGHLLALPKRVDPNFKRVPCHSFKDNLSTARMDAIETFVKKK